MANLKTIGKRIGRGVVSVAPYALANAGAAFVADSGIDSINQVVDLPQVVDDTLFYSSLGLFNLGVVYPIATEGLGNFVRNIFGRNTNVIGRNRLKAGLLAGLTALVVSGGREAFENIDVPSNEEQVIRNLQGNPELEGRIQNYIDNLRGRGLARARGVEDYSIYMKDLKSDEIFVEVNSDRQQMGASTLKLAVLAAGFESIHERRLVYTSEIKSDMEAMICRSNNNATNRMINRVGLDDINNFVKEQGLYQTVVDLIPAGGRTLDNKTSARDLGNLLESIYEGRLHGSDEMKRILAMDCSGHSDRLVDNTCIPIKQADLRKTGGFVDEVYGKTGTTYGVNANAGVVEAEFLGSGLVPYVAVIMVEDRSAKRDKSRGSYGIWGPRKSETLRSIAEACYWYLHEKYSEKDFKCKDHNGVHPK